MWLVPTQTFRPLDTIFQHFACSFVLIICVMSGDICMSHIKMCLLPIKKKVGRNLHHSIRKTTARRSTNIGV